MSFVSLERSGVIATGTLNRPERLNALGREFLSDFHSVLTEAAAIGSNVRFLICKRTLGEAPANDRFGRRLPFTGIAIAIDCITATKGWSRPKTAFQVR